MADDDYADLSPGNVSVRVVNLDSANGYLTCTVRVERQRREWYPAHGATPEDLPADVRETLTDWLVRGDGWTAAEWREWAQARVFPGAVLADAELAKWIDTSIRSDRDAGDALREIEWLTADELADEIAELGKYHKGASVIVSREWLASHIPVRVVHPPAPGDWVRYLPPDGPDDPDDRIIGKLSIANPHGVGVTDSPEYVVELEDGDWFPVESLAWVERVDEPVIKLEREVTE